MVNGQWSMVNGQWSMVNGQWSHRGANLPAFILFSEGILIGIKAGSDYIRNKPGPHAAISFNHSDKPPSF
jgi:hypothetical protein